MTAQWTIHATLDDGPDGYRLGMTATRIVDGETHTTSDFTVVHHHAEARMECQRFAEVLGISDYVLEDRRRTAA